MKNLFVFFLCILYLYCKIFQLLPHLSEHSYLHVHCSRYQHRVTDSSLQWARPQMVCNLEQGIYTVWLRQGEALQKAVTKFALNQHHHRPKTLTTQAFKGLPGNLESLFVVCYKKNFQQQKLAYMSSRWNLKEYM